MSWGGNTNSDKTVSRLVWLWLLVLAIQRASCVEAAKILSPSHPCSLVSRWCTTFAMNTNELARSKMVSHRKSWFLGNMLLQLEDVSEGHCWCQHHFRMNSQYSPWLFNPFPTSRFFILFPVSVSFPKHQSKLLLYLVFINYLKI